MESLMKCLSKRHTPVTLDCHVLHFTSLSLLIDFQREKKICAMKRQKFMELNACYILYVECKLTFTSFALPGVFCELHKLINLTLWIVCLSDFVGRLVNLFVQLFLAEEAKSILISLMSVFKKQAKAIEFLTHFLFFFINRKDSQSNREAEIRWILQ